MNENPSPKQQPEVPEELLDEISAGAVGADHVTPPDPFVKAQR